MFISKLADLFTRLRLVIERVTNLMGYASGWGFIFCSAFICFDVLARRFLGFSSQATTEITSYILAFGLAWGLAHTLSMRAHVRIDLLINKLPAKLRYWMHFLSLLMLGVFIGFLAKASYDLVAESVLFGATDTSTLQIPLAIPQGLWAAGIGVFALMIGVMVVENMLLLLAGRGAEAEANLVPRSYSEDVAEALEAVGLDASAQTKTQVVGVKTS
ncbi:MAG: TRAP transporter small permease subunit [Rhabdaerophilum sp.]